MEKFFNWQRRQHSKSAIYSNWYKDTTETPKSNEPIVSNQNDVTIQISVQFQHRNNMINELRRPASSSNVTGSGRDRCLSTVCDVADKKRRATNTSDRMSTWNGPLEIADGHSDGRTDAICAAFILFAVYIFSLFLARHALLKVVIGQFVIGGLTVASGLDAKRLFKSNVKVFWLYEHKHSTREREREEISLSLLVALLCTCMESESRTSEESSFYLKGFFFSTRDPVWVKFFCLSLLYVSIWLCYAIVLCSVWSWPTQGNFISICDQVGQIDRLYMSIDSSSSYIIHNVLFFLPHSQSINTFWKNSFKLSYGTWEELSRGLSSSIFIAGPLLL